MTAATTPYSLATIVELLSRESTSGHTNLPLTTWISEEIARLDLPVVTQASPGGHQENLLVTLPDSRGNTSGGLLLSGHLDTVPVEGQIWTSPPFEPEVRNGRLYGRGATDMKSFCGSVIAHLPKFTAAPLAVPLHIALTYDEETGCAGASHLLELLTDERRRPRAAIIGEPTSMRVVTAHKGCLRYRVTFRGRSVHSSLAPAGVNAAVFAGRFVASVADIADGLITGGPFDDRFTVPSTTVSIGPVHGGTEPNIVPDLCEVHIEIRPIPGHDVDRLKRRICSVLAELGRAMQQLDPTTSATIEPVVDVPALNPSSDNAASALLDCLLDHSSEGEAVSYGTEAGLFQEAGIHTVICGPGSIAQAHIPDEYIELDQIHRCDEFLERLCIDLQSSQSHTARLCR